MKARDYTEGYYQLQEKSLILFSPGLQDFQLVNDDEILAGGNLYDIVKIEINNGKPLYYTLSDEEEDACIQQLAGLSKSNSQEQSLPSKTLGLHIEKYFEVINYNCPVFSTLFRVHETVKSSNYLFQYISPLKIVFSPPPDLLLS